MDYVLRRLATEHDLPEVASCDRCADRNADGRLSLAGSAAWILEECDHQGVEVDRREALAYVAAQPAIPGRLTLSQRVILLCSECSEDIGWPLDHVAIESGYEEAFERMWEKLEDEED